MTTERDKRHQIVSQIMAEVSKVVIGKEEIKELLLVALLSQGHVLIEGLPGTAKTTLARTFAQVIGGRFKRIQGTPDMLPADVLGFYHYRPDGSASFMPGPIFANVILADELNRTTPRTQSALLEAMQEWQVTIERETHTLEQPFIVIGSQLPYGGAGTSPLSEVQIDRFMFRIWSGFPAREEERQILRDIDQITEPHVSSVATPSDIIWLQQEVKKVYIADSIHTYIIDILDRLRHHQDLLLGPSPRGGIALLRGARALAFVQGRDFVIPDDVKRLLIPALCHRLRLSSEAEMEDVTPEAVINEVAAEVPVPKEGTASTAKGSGGATGEALEVSADVFEKVPSRGEEAGEAETENAGVLTGIPDEVDERVGESDSETGGEAGLLPASSEEVSGRAKEVLANVGETTRRMLAEWEWVLIVCALVIAVVMICVGLLSIR
mgnify:CR=1 FL=1